MCASSTQHNSFGLGSPERSRNWRLLYLPFVLLLGLACLILTTQRVAAFYGYDPALGASLGLGIGLRRPLVCAVGDFPLARGIRGQ